MAADGSHFVRRSNRVDRQALLIDRVDMGTHILGINRLPTLGDERWEPQGVAVNRLKEIIVLERHNNFIAILKPDGVLRQCIEIGIQIDEPLYGYRIAIRPSNCDIHVTVPSPIPHIQVYNWLGTFLRKIAVNIVKKPRAISISNTDKILVVGADRDIFLLDITGKLMSRFRSTHLRSPQTAVMNNKEEIFVTDSVDHSVKVVNFNGSILREIGGRGVTLNPFGVMINPAGQVIIAGRGFVIHDQQRLTGNLHLTVFDKNHSLKSAHRCDELKQVCHDIALYAERTVVVATETGIYLYNF